MGENVFWSEDGDFYEEEFALDDFVACVIQDCPDWDLFFCFWFDFDVEMGGHGAKYLLVNSHGKRGKNDQMDMTRKSFCSPFLSFPNYNDPTNKKTKQNKKPLTRSSSCRLACSTTSLSPLNTIVILDKSSTSVLATTSESMLNPLPARIPETLLNTPGSFWTRQLKICFWRC